MRKNIEELNKILKYQKLANYITVLEMYLKDNLFLERKLTKEDLKKVSVGHWGCSPAINFLYAHLNSYSKRKNKKLKIVVGTGHAGASVMANLYLMGYTSYERNIDGLNKLINDFGSKIRTEINPSYNGTYYDGGELGYSLAFSYGLSLSSNDLVVCIFGDGEAETGTLSASLKLVKLIKNNVLPILNLNGLKIVVDCANGASYKVAPTIFWELGAEVIKIGCEPNGTNINDNTLGRFIRATNNCIKNKKILAFTDKKRN